MFRNDYSETAAKEVLQAILSADGEQNIGYGEDIHTRHAAELIRKRFALPDAEVFFLAGGTQTNMTVISYLLRPYESVICCDTGHINVHETGAVEASGHKVCTCKNEDGKLRPEDVLAVCAHHSDEHMVKPAMIYISDSTETGTVYTKAELLALREVCDEKRLLLFLDGARLGVAMTSKDTDVVPAFLAEVCDVFYIGGTKNGALFGEAVVIKDKALASNFRYHIKNRGAMLAKGFVTGLQFEALFTDDLYFRLADHSNFTAGRIRAGLKELSVPLYGNSNTNQIFVTLPESQAQALIDEFGCERWTETGEGTVVRIVTSFATDPEECDALLEFLASIL